MKNTIIVPEDYRDDRLYVMRLTSDFTRNDEGTYSASLVPSETLDKSGKLILITYRNTHQLPATRVDEFSSYEEVINYIHRAEPTCPRVSLGGAAPNPTPSWQNHLEWLHSLGLKSAAEGDSPKPDWTSTSNNPREIIQVKPK